MKYLGTAATLLLLLTGLFVGCSGKEDEEDPTLEESCRSLCKEYNVCFGNGSGPVIDCPEYCEEQVEIAEESGCKSEMESFSECWVDEFECDASYGSGDSDIPCESEVYRVERCLEASASSGS